MSHYVSGHTLMVFSSHSSKQMVPAGVRLLLSGTAVNTSLFLKQQQQQQQQQQRQQQQQQFERLKA